MLAVSIAWQTSITLGKAPQAISQTCPPLTSAIYFLHSFANTLPHIVRKRLDARTQWSKGLFQPKWFYNSMILYWSWPFIIGKMPTHLHECSQDSSGFANIFPETFRVTVIYKEVSAAASFLQKKLPKPLNRSSRFWSNKLMHNN